MKILALETSCDDTAVSVVEITPRATRVLFEVASSQVTTHAKYGGIVPEVAARMHCENIGPIIREALQWHSPDTIDRIAVTAGPGLITSLLIGVETAKTLAYALRKPIIAVHHVEGHIYSSLIKNRRVRFPALALIVSGGHTDIILMTGFGQYQIVGRTQDDAAGEAFDKVAKLLRLGYPGGPIIQARARRGRPAAFALPRPMLEQKNFDFSFAGLKTAVLYLYQSGKIPSSKINNLCASFQQAVVDVLVTKTLRAAEKYGVKTILLGGGVAANTLLRATLTKEANRRGYAFRMPTLFHSTDNATMIAQAAYYRKPTPWQRIKADPNLPL